MEQLIHPSVKWAYEKRGQGKEVVLIFHGFGQTHQDMLTFDRLRKPNQTFLFVDMIYHGKTQWMDSERPFSRQIWKETIRLMQKKEGFDRFHLIGYSMGGKFALLTYEILPNEVRSITLIAPDGIKTGHWYSMSNYPKSIHPIFKRLIFKPKRFFSLVDSLHSVGFLEKSLVKFVKSQLETRSKRAQAYFVWKVVGSLQLQLGKIILAERDNPIPMSLFTGEFDKMVTAKSLERFSSKITHLQKISLPVGHGGLIEAAADFLLSNSAQGPN
jgi:pimeloyl-ACP methyl ester carboxylesterase